MMIITTIEKNETLKKGTLDLYTKAEISSIILVMLVK